MKFLICSLLLSLPVLAQVEIEFESTGAVIVTELDCEKARPEIYVWQTELADGVFHRTSRIFGATISKELCGKVKEFLTYNGAESGRQGHVAAAGHRFFDISGSPMTWDGKDSVVVLQNTILRWTYRTSGRGDNRVSQISKELVGFQGNNSRIIFDSGIVRH
jgi:hypothetical protein